MLQFFKHMKPSSKLLDLWALGPVTEPNHYCEAIAIGLDLINICLAHHSDVRFGPTIEFRLYFCPVLFPLPGMSLLDLSSSHHFHFTHDPWLNPTFVRLARSDMNRRP